MNNTNMLNEMDCTFYFLLKEDDKTIVLKEEIQKRICGKFEEMMGIRFYGMRSGSGIRSTDLLKKELSGTIPEQIDVILIDRKKDDVSLLSSEQRDMFFERVMAAEEDMDTVTIAEAVINETEND